MGRCRAPVFWDAWNITLYKLLELLLLKACGVSALQLLYKCNALLDSG